MIDLTIEPINKVKKPVDKKFKLRGKAKLSKNVHHNDPIEEVLFSRKKLKLGIEKISLAEAQKKKIPCYRAPPH